MPPSIDNISITTDFLRLGHNLQDRESFSKNTEWFYHLVNKQVTYASTKNVTWHDWAEHSDIDGHIFYETLNLEPTINNWASSHHATNISEQEFSYFTALIDQYFSNSLVIGFEISPLIQRALSHAKIPFINTLWHPVRFMDDIFFGFATNHEDIFDKIAQYQLPQHRMFQAAEEHRARNIRTPLNIENNSALFIGQTPADRSLIKNGKIATIQDFKTEITSLNQQFNLRYKPHPFCENDTLFETFWSDMGIKKINPEHNMYHLLASENIAHVASISSSVVAEAAYFEVDGSKFITQEETFTNEDTAPFSESTYLPVFHHFLDSNFWANILSPIIENTQTHNQSIPAKPNRLRSVNGAFWGFNEDEAKNIIMSYNSTE